MRRPTTVQIQEFQSALLRWSVRSGRKLRWRRRSASLYELIVAEVLLQRTRAEIVSAFLPGFVRRYSSWRKLAQASEEDLEILLRPLGLWRRRAAGLRALALAMRARRGRFPIDRAEIEQLPGVGQYIANAICLFAHKQPTPLLDVNMARVLERCFGPRRLADIRYDAGLQEVAHSIVAGESAPHVNWAILDLAALVCRPTGPRCGACPLEESCAEGKRRQGRGS